MAEIKITGKSASVQQAKRNITITSEGGAPALEITNEYGNSVKHEISDSYRFNSLFASLWQFVKDSQH